MFIVYKATHRDKYYIGFTNNLAARIASHRNAVKSGKNTKFYAYARRHGFENFTFSIISEFHTKEEALRFEVSNIALTDPNCLNLAVGGEGGFMVPEHEKANWIEKLKKSREGRKPALGMQHSEDNKKVFGEHGKARWDKYGRYPLEVLQLPFMESNKKYGISRTHYYRLKRAEANDFS